MAYAGFMLCRLGQLAQVDSYSGGKVRLAWIKRAIVPQEETWAGVAYCPRRDVTSGAHDTGGITLSLTPARPDIQAQLGPPAAAADALRTDLRETERPVSAGP